MPKQIEKPTSKKTVEDFHYAVVEISNIKPHPIIPDRIDLGDIDSLTESIKETDDVHIDPILVETEKETVYFRVQGKRRIEAAKRIGKTTIHCKIYRKDTPPTKLFEIADSADDSAYSKDRNAFEKGMLFDAWLKLGLTEEDIAKKKGKDQTTISKYINVFRKLYPHAQKYEHVHNLNIHMLCDLLKLADMPAVLEEMFKKINKNPEMPYKEFKLEVDYLFNAHEHETFPLSPTIIEKTDKKEFTPYELELVPSENQAKGSVAPTEEKLSDYCVIFNGVLYSLVTELCDCDWNLGKCEKCGRGCPKVLLDSLQHIEHMKPDADLRRKLKKLERKLENSSGEKEDSQPGT